MFLLGITVRLAKSRWNLCASSGVVNKARSKVVFLWTSIFSSMIGRFPLLSLRCAPPGVFYLLSLVHYASDLFPLVPTIFATTVLFPLLPVELTSAGACFEAMDIWFGLEVFREDEEDEGKRRRKGSRLGVGFPDRSTLLLYGNAYSLSTDTF